MNIKTARSWSIRPARIHDWALAITPEEYTSFKANPATRLYVHTYHDGVLTVSSSRPYKLAKDLEKAIDFGATSAQEVLALPYRA